MADIEGVHSRRQAVAATVDYAARKRAHLKAVAVAAGIEDEVVPPRRISVEAVEADAAGSYSPAVRRHARRTLAIVGSAPIDANVVVKASQASRPRERREQRHRARSSSSADSPDDSDGPSPAGQRCEACGAILLWHHGELVCCNRACARWGL